MKLQPHHYAALERALATFEAHAKRITENDPFDHDAGFPEGDANSIKEIIHYLKATQAPNDYLAGWIVGYQQAKSIEGAYSITLAKRVERLETSLELQTALLADANAQLNAMRKERDDLLEAMQHPSYEEENRLRAEVECLTAERDELRSVIEQAHHIVCTYDRVWGGEMWVIHPLSTVSRAHLRRVLEGRVLPEPLKEGE